ncbi:hypothetical protein FRC05_004328 [Tulasnella sp. 425]|nr:hypothetical protein FRC05_004328 [Tulasnella sp. 425]
MSHQDLDGAARLLHVPIPATVHSRDGVGSLLKDHLLTCITKERELAGGCLEPLAKERIENHFGASLHALTEILRVEESAKFAQRAKEKNAKAESTKAKLTQKAKEKRFNAKAAKIQTAFDADEAYDASWPQIPSDMLSPYIVEFCPPTSKI